MTTLSTIATNYLEAIRWLEQCPFTDGQPFYETAGRELDEWYEAMLELAEQHHPELYEPIRLAVSEGLWGKQSEQEFWEELIRRAS